MSAPFLLVSLCTAVRIYWYVYLHKRSHRYNNKIKLYI